MMKVIILERFIVERHGPATGGRAEAMEGENKYFAEGYGLQDAKKGVKFDSSPRLGECTALLAYSSGQSKKSGSCEHCNRISVRKKRAKA